MSCKFSVFMPVSSDWPIEGEAQILLNRILIILLLFYYAKAFTNTRTVSLDVLLSNVVEGIAELFVWVLTPAVAHRALAQHSWKPAPRDAELC